MMERQEAYLSQIDPYGNDMITLSDCITLFNNELTDGKVSIL